MSHYIQKTIPNAKFETENSSSFGDITKFPWEEGVIRFGYLSPENGFDF